MLSYLACSFILVAFSLSFLCLAREIAFTFDGAPTPDSALMTGAERTKKITLALQQAKVPDALFL